MTPESFQGKTVSMPFVVFEGLDGSGKSTLIRGLEGRLKAAGKDVLVTREPGGTALGDELRQILLRTTHEAPHPRTELLLYEASRAEHVERKIRPALQKGSWVLCDRFEASSVAFQSGGRDISVTQVYALNTFATGGLTADLTVLLDLPVAESLKRMTSRESMTGVAKDRFEREQTEFHERVRTSFLTQFEEAHGSQETRGIWLKLDGTQSPEQCLEKLMAQILVQFQLGLA